MRRTSASDIELFIEGEDELFADPTFVAALEDASARERLLADLVLQRRAMKLKQSDVAELMGTTQSAVSDIERGTDAHLSTVQRYARAVAARLQLRVELPAACPWHPADQWASETAPVRYQGRQTTLQQTRDEPRGAVKSSDVLSGWLESLHGVEPERVSVGALAGTTV